MKKLLLLVLVVASVCSALAQPPQYRFYRSLEAYMAGNYDSLGFFEIVPRFDDKKNPRHPSRNGIEHDIFCVDSVDMENDKFLRKEVLLFQNDAVLYVNINRLKRGIESLYVPAMVINGEIYFLRFPGNPGNAEVVAMSGALFGIVGAAIAAGTISVDSRFRELCYYDPVDKKIRVTEYEEIRNLLRACPDIMWSFQREMLVYDSPAAREKAFPAIAWRYMKQLQAMNTDPKTDEQIPADSLPSPTP